MAHGMKRLLFLKARRRRRTFLFTQKTGMAQEKDRSIRNARGDAVFEKKRFSRSSGRNLSGSNRGILGWK